MSLRRLCSILPAEGAYTPIGSFDQQVQLLMPTGRAADGGDLPYSVFAISWADIRPLSARETDKGQQILQEVSHLVTIPYMPGVTQAMLVSFGNRTFQIEAVEDPDERQVELRIYCAERGQNA